MTLLAPSSVTGVGSVVPAAASLAIRPLLDGHPTRAEVLGTGGSLMWLAVGSDCVVLTAGRAGRLPNGLEAPSAPWERLLVSEEVAVGDGVVALDGFELGPTRWWDPRPRIGTVEAPSVEAALGSQPPSAPDVELAGLEEALRHRDDEAVIDAARPLLGRGDGLTPLGDDIVSGAVSAFRVFGDALGDPSAGDTLDRCRRRLLDLARRATTVLSVSLIGHALAGRVAAPVGPFLAALAGRGDPASTREAVVRIGHSSGAGLAAGIVAGARSAVRGTS